MTWIMMNVGISIIPPRMLGFVLPIWAPRFNVRVTNTVRLSNVLSMRNSHYVTPTYIFTNMHSKRYDGWFD